MNSIIIRTIPGTYHHRETYEMVNGVTHEIGCIDGDGNEHVIVTVRLDPFYGAKFTPVSNIWQGEYIDLVIACLAKAKELIGEFQIANQQ